MAERRLRCAIYTRKSSEEGLEQDFNSLHAQREACEAYIASQKQEGWIAIRTHYDDGGYSGGSMERPALKQLLADIASGTIDVVVVYKVDRLTRALADFAKIVEIFDANNVSFVSVTQAFNTTSSMGRLTLNVLLSFAQFEREVTGERIRDKIAASKKKGIWMGGTTPLGYEVKDRRLIIVPEHAQLVRRLFALYLECGSVEALQQRLNREQVRTPIRRSRSGHEIGNAPFGRGALYHLLQNPVYIGKIRHKQIVHDGQHDPIIPDDLWTQVQARLASNRHVHHVTARARNPALLAGLIETGDGQHLIASYAVKNGQRYRYYRSPRNGAANNQTSPSISLAAAPIEQAVCTILCRTLSDQAWLLQTLAPANNAHAVLNRAAHLANILAGHDTALLRHTLADLVTTVRLFPDRIEIVLRTQSLNEALSPDTSPTITIAEPITFARRGSELKILIPASGPPEPEPDPALIKAIAQAHRWWRDLTNGTYGHVRELAEAYDTHERYVGFVLRLAFLSPELTKQILAGTQPLDLTLHHLLKKADIPGSWHGQKKLVPTQSCG